MVRLCSTPLAGWRMLWAVLFLALSGNSYSAEINLPFQYPVLEAENRVWIGTPAGLYQYNPDDDSFKRTSPPTERQIPEIKQLYYHDEWLWCVLDSGLAALHIRLNEWLFF